MKDPMVIKDKKLTIPSNIVHKAVVVEEERNKLRALKFIIDKLGVKRGVIFTHQDASLKQLVEMCNKNHIPAMAVHKVVEALSCVTSLC